jgi:hypothetical protein
MKAEQQKTPFRASLDNAMVAGGAMALLGGCGYISPDPSFTQSLTTFSLAGNPIRFLFCFLSAYNIGVKICNR